MIAAGEDDQATIRIKKYAMDFVQIAKKLLGLEFSKEGIVVAKKFKLLVFSSRSQRDRGHMQL